MAPSFAAIGVLRPMISRAAKAGTMVIPTTKDAATEKLTDKISSLKISAITHQLAKRAAPPPGW
jgi:hypothetical protein